MRGGASGPAAGLDQRRAVQVIALRGSGVRALGSGYLVTGEAVLTAAHVVRGATALRVRFITTGGRAVELPGMPVWEHHESDVAVVGITPDTADADVGGLLAGTLPPVRFARVNAAMECEALGFPRFMLRRDALSAERFRDSHHARGSTTPWSKLRGGGLAITVVGAPGDAPEREGSAWEGMSGAAVWSDGCIVGVVSEHHPREGAGTLTATRVARWFDVMDSAHLDQLHELIGLPADADRLEQLPRPPEPPDETPELEERAKLLARAVREQWRAERRRRRLNEPFALAVRFGPAVSARFAVPADTFTAASGKEVPSELGEQLKRIVEAYRAIPSGRLVVLGEAGAGKTVLALYFVLELLGTRPRGAPVPVIFSLGSWDPGNTTLEAWLSGRLVRDYPDLAVPGPYGGNLAETLVREERILPVLDGFDEIAADLRGEALRALSQSDMPMLLTSRPAEYADAVEEEGILVGAPGIELGSLTPGDCAHYLRDASRPRPDGDGRGSVWDPLLEELDRHPRTRGASNVAAALTTPLMASLARAIYSDAPGADPRELLEFPTSEALQEHLLENFLPAVYHPRRAAEAGGGAGRPLRWDLRRAESCLGHLAGHLDLLSRHTGREGHDLAWWELGTTLTRSTRTLVIGSLSGLAFGLTTAIANLPVILVATSHGLGFALLRGALAGVLHGLAAGVFFGLAYHFTSGDEKFKPSPVRISILDRLKPSGGAKPPRAHREIRPRVMIGLGGGLVLALVLVAIDRGVIEPLGLADGQAGGLSSAFLFVAEISLGAGIVFGLMAWLETPVAHRSAVELSDLLEMNRRNVVFHWLAWVCVLGPVVGLVEGILHGPVRGIEVGIVFGLVTAFAGGTGYGLCMTAWCQWVALCRIYLPLRGRLPWALIAFLDDAHERGVLHRVGAVYQFRHARLQSHLSPSHTEEQEPAPAPPTPTGARS